MENDIECPIYMLESNNNYKNSVERCLQNDQAVFTSGFPTLSKL